MQKWEACSIELVRTFVCTYVPKSCVSNSSFTTEPTGFRRAKKTRHRVQMILKEGFLEPPSSWFLCYFQVLSNFAQSCVLNFLFDITLIYFKLACADQGNGFFSGLYFHWSY